ncbi:MULTISPECIES: hypothetical protein [Flectobacillus]|uniref:Uncharacterized protein n=1 Tax=Flectobacillus roseus TaxID=502259 RepID=A0ABT6YCP1_9BACT|nr:MULTISPECIES: hypothetical protein [Flectobacillus]MDI9861346.1 hypothetical protein [Flectobacillus roseus]PAC32958.1 hypothetical protein BWI92_03760 [Flectobacillus sp. BAB-3569]
MKDSPVILTPESVELLVANIAEELLRGQNTYKSETQAVRKRIKIGMLKTLSYQEILYTNRQASKLEPVAQSDLA